MLVLTLYLGLHNGYLAIYDAGENNPSDVLPYRAALYPKLDRESLKQGIPIRSAEHLKQLLEDFLA